ncbi:hypothetical protein CWC23_18145, partial [Pseudoalteromonas ruthenica]
VSQLRSLRSIELPHGKLKLQLKPGSHITLNWFKIIKIWSYYPYKSFKRIKNSWIFLLRR